jgi:hypothetical protein
MSTKIKKRKSMSAKIEEHEKRAQEMKERGSMQAQTQKREI